MGRFPFAFGKRSISYITWPWGLANRVLPIGCTLSLAKQFNYKPMVVWTSDDVVAKAYFRDLFDTANLPFTLIEGYQAWTIRFASLSQEKNLSVPKRIIGSLILRLFDYDKVILLKGREAHIRFCERQNLNFTRYRKIAIYAHMPFRYEYDIDWLKPAPSIAPRVIELKKQFTPNTLGVHLRGTDATDNPPVEKIIMRMRAEVEFDSNVKFFFASDNDKSSKAVIDIFGDRLIMNTDNAPRGTLEGQKDAVVDLFGLAGTSRIIGPKYSTFSMLATMMGNRPSLRITNRNSVANP